MVDEILKAILERRIIEFTYDGRRRVCEPHVFGIANQKNQVLCYQTEGGSKRGGIPFWRRFDLAGIVEFELMDDKFSGPRPIPTGPHSIWDTVLLVVT